MMFTKQRKTAYILLIINTIIWGAALPVVKNSYDHTTSFHFLFYRYIFASLTAIPILIYYFPRIKNQIKKISLITLLELFGVTLNLSLLYLGLEKTTSIEAGLITVAGPILTVIGGVIFLKEKEEKNEFVGLLIILAGTTLITLIPIFSDELLDIKFSLLGNLLVFGYTVVNSIYFILAKKYYKDIPKLYTSGTSFFVGLISFFIIFLIDAGSFSEFTSTVSSELSQPSVIFAAVFMGIPGSLIALTCYMIAQQLIEVSEASLFGYLQPVITIVLGFFWLNEELNYIQLIGIILITVGLIVSSVRMRK